MKSVSVIALSCLTLLTGCAGNGSSSDSSRQTSVSLVAKTTTNQLAYVPPQCFTKTTDASGGPAQNPCYACHAEVAAPNYNNRPELQLSYAFPQVAAGVNIANPWTNLFRDWSAAAANVSDAEIRQYVNTDNYLGEAGRIILAAKLGKLASTWDFDGDGTWGGYSPDAYFNFDAHGFDRAPDGSATGWRAFAYYPFPGAFMPTNGAFDDVLIRLPTAFRQDSTGAEDLGIYSINLAIVESLIKRTDVAIPATDEIALGVDLDNDGNLSTATTIKFHWNPASGDSMSYVGKARALQAVGHEHAAAGLFPDGTEFLHSVRYLGLDQNGNVVPAARMKELRYARKAYWMSYSDLNLHAQMEAADRRGSPDQPEIYGGDAEHGLNNTVGWTYQGFIEDKNGDLRPQSYEETLFCMGCHTGLSATEDGAFAFPRKVVTGAANGWYHWNSGSSAKLPDPARRDGRLEFTTYLMNNGAGDEFRGNTEVKSKFFNADGTIKAEMFAALANDVSTLLLPSPQRALALDKAYSLLVKEQSFVLGRDAPPSPEVNVWDKVGQGRSTEIQTPQPAPRLALP